MAGNSGTPRAIASAPTLDLVALDSISEGGTRGVKWSTRKSHFIEKGPAWLD